MVLKVSLNTGINRIRLEFKEDHSCFLATKTARVLIESDWNLKEAVKFKDLLPILTGINRIRLEFKGHIKMPDDS